MNSRCRTVSAENNFCGRNETCMKTLWFARFCIRNTHYSHCPKAVLHGEMLWILRTDLSEWKTIHINAIKQVNIQNFIQTTKPVIHALQAKDHAPVELTLLYKNLFINMAYLCIPVPAWSSLLSNTCIYRLSVKYKYKTYRCNLF